MKPRLNQFGQCFVEQLCHFHMTSSTEVRPRPHLIQAFSPIVHTKTNEKPDENGGFRKQFQKWSFLKKFRFKYFRFHRRLRALKRYKNYGVSNKTELVWTGQNYDAKTPVRVRIICFDFFKIKTETFENSLGRSRIQGRE